MEDSGGQPWLDLDVFRQLSLFKYTSECGSEVFVCVFYHNPEELVLKYRRSMY